VPRQGDARSGKVKQTARVIVWEETGAWAAHLRLAMGESSRSIYPCRTSEACYEALQRWPASMLAIEVTADRFETTLTWLAEQLRRKPAARAVVLAEPDLQGAAAVIRESGAIDIVFGPRHMKDIAELSQRHLARAAEPDLGLRERILSRLPWGD